MELAGWSLFWDFVRERHRVYLRRSAGEPRPWTDDRIIRDYFFTNVYRELDPGTVFIQDWLKLQRDAPVHDKLFNVMLYRLCLREESFEAIGWLSVGDFNPGAFRAFLEQADRPFHNAYMISNQNTSMPKVELLAETAHDWTTWLPMHERRWPDRRSFIKWLSKARGMGPFLATQVLADLTYEDHIGLTAEGYVELGAGARRGLAALLEGPERREWLPVAQAQEVLSYVWENQGPEHDGVLPEWLTKMNMQNCCCEFSKYVRGGGRRRYKGEARLL